MSRLINLSTPLLSVLVFAKVESNDLIFFQAVDLDGCKLLKSDESLKQALLGRLSVVIKRGRVESDTLSSPSSSSSSSSYFALVKITIRNGEGASSFLDSLSQTLQVSLVTSHSRSEQGLRSWLKIYNEKGGVQSIDSRELQRQVDEEVLKFDNEETRKDVAKKELVARMQADGFTLVTRKTRIEDGNDEYESSTFKKKRKRGDISAGVDFYSGSSSQVRRDKALRITTLRNEFEKDKEKINELKGKKENGRVFRG
jgi:hypothetical protein